MKREELFIDILGDLDPEYVMLAMPGHTESHGTAAVTDTRVARLRSVIGYTAGIAAVIVACVFGLKFLAEHGGLKEGGPEPSESITAVITDIEPDITEENGDNEENEIAKYLKTDYTRSVQMAAREATTGSVTLIYELTGKYKDKFYLKAVSGYELEHELQQDSRNWYPYDRDNSWKTMVGGNEEITIRSLEYEYISFPAERIETDGEVEMRCLSLTPGHYRIRKPLHAYSTETDEEIAVFNAYAEFYIYDDTPNILGITMSVKDVFSDLGLTLEIRQGNYSTDRYMGQITYDHQYTITGYSEETGWDYVPYKSSDTTPEAVGVGETREEWIDWSGERALRYGRYRVEKTFYDTDPVSGRQYCSVTSYAYFDIRPQQQTFDVKYYYMNDLAGIAAGYAPPFQSSPHDIYADGTGWEWIGYADCKGFFTSDHDKFPNEVPAELIDILRNYADGDDLKPDFGGNFDPITERYQILSNNEAYPSGDGITAYRIYYMPGNDFLITTGWDNKILVFRENTKYTAARRVMELLWANSNPSFEVFAVLDSNNGERVEYLMIVASDDYFALGEEDRFSALERVRSLLAERNLLDDDLIKFMTPEQLRETWIPVEVIDDTGRLNDSMIRVADRVFRLVNNETMDFEEYKKFLADNGVIAPDASREEIFGLGNRVTPYRDMFDILDIEADESYDFWDYSQITDEIIHSTAFDADTNYVWSYDKPLSQAVWKVVRLRMLQRLCPQIKKIDLVVGSEPDEYRIIVHASTSDRELLKNNQAFELFYDPEIIEFAE